MKVVPFIITLCMFILTGCSDNSPTRTPSPRGAKVFIIEPKDNSDVTSPIKVKFGIEGMELSPAGVEKENSGHHHLLIDTQLEDKSSSIPANENILHFGKGQTETQIELKPGKHSLQLILGDHNHIPHEPIVQSNMITINVK